MKLACVGCIASAVSLVAGCFTGKYEQGMRKIIDEAGQRSAKLKYLYETPSAFADPNVTGLQLQLPLFVENATALQKGSPGEEHMQPPFVALPGFNYAFEVPLSADGGTSYPGYIYFASVAASEKSPDQVATEIQAAVSKKFPDAVWQDVKLETPSGGSLPLKVLEATGQQDFGGTKLDGSFRLYLYPTTDYTALLGWRAPLAVAGKVNFFEAAQASSSTLTGG
jgi:hypothetical protein